MLKIKWQRLVDDQQTCQRCESTGEELEKAVAILQDILKPFGIKVVLEKVELSIDDFHKNPLESNKIWINEKLIEDWLRGSVGKSPCCDICSPYECRTIELNGRVYETINSELIVKAGLLAALNLINKSCCESCIE
ncbi:MAG: DUF2703 domain-containing protein [Aigarchaeota archaeon]|nr:DUF2703 domain-containing protein [Aigarchaeota archaeon]MCX8193146.1 DUF2703 domain-containing protein [Nitrososphaeria archaeon]MDW7986769.1 DUF2703 domain-containing protein [Nitrososphaerota archaeon]